MPSSWDTLRFSVVCAFTPATNKMPNLFNYRWVPRGLWVEAIDVSMSRTTSHSLNSSSLASRHSSLPPDSPPNFFLMISTSRYSCPFVIPSSWVWVGPNDFLLLKRTQQKQQNVPSEIMLQKDSSFHLAYALLVSHLLTLMEPVAVLWAAL